MKILDCTFRDGGYYTNWNFPKDLVRTTVKALDDNRIDVIELGYKSPQKGGPYRKTNDGFINDLLDFDINAELAFMIDAKDFIDQDLLDDCVLDREKSRFSVCRLALKMAQLPRSITIMKRILDKGYDLHVNLMCLSQVLDCNIIEFMTIASQFASTLHFADSFGGVTTARMDEICKVVSPFFASCGLHCHDNMGLAFANSLLATEHGFTWLDATITGMGRGVGNTKTEQLIVHRNDTISPSMLDVLARFKRMQQEHGWGFNPLYMLGALNNVHPTYMQRLSNTVLSSEAIVNAAHGLSDTSTFSEEILKEKAPVRPVVVIPARYKSSRFPGKPLANINGKPMVLHVAENASKAVGKDNVYIATENEEISKVVQDAGFHVVLTSDNCLTGTDRLAEASLEIDADIFVNVQGDEPMLDPQDIVRAINLKIQHPNHVINCMAKLNVDEDPNSLKIPKVVCDLNNNLLYASRHAIPGSKMGTSENTMKQVCIYAFSGKELKEFNRGSKTPLEFQEDIEILRCVELGMPVKMMLVTHTSYAVDYPEDIEIIERML